MKRDKIQEGRFSEHGHGLGTVTHEMVRRRARELAIINGREPEQILGSDLAQARRELTGESGLNPPDSPAESIPEEERWDPQGDNTGEKLEALPAADEQTFAEKLVEEGVEDAEQDHMLRATQESLRRETEG